MTFEMETKTLITDQNQDYNSLGNVNPLNPDDEIVLDDPNDVKGQTSGVCVTWSKISARVTVSSNNCFSCCNSDARSKVILNKGMCIENNSDFLYGRVSEVSAMQFRQTTQILSNTTEIIHEHNKLI